MRRYNINSDWKFTKGSGGQAANVNLPHVWDIRGGQNGNGGYVGPCTYEKNIRLSEEWAGKDIYLEVGAANSVAEIYVNGKMAGIHKGGYSLFRMEITPWLVPDQENLIMISVDNTTRDDVYPIAADYTFFGGIYRDVNLIVAEKPRFSLDDDGSEGVYVRTHVADGKGRIFVDCVVDSSNECEIRCQVFDEDGKLCGETAAGAQDGVIELFVDNPRLWEGEGRGTLYLLTVNLQKGGRWIEERSIKIGFRNIQLTSDGFFLNGKPLPLRGVARHQDREDRGWAITRKDMEEDMELIREIGANSVRLAHYQHAPYFYDLCDREGLVVWTEIPYISRLSPRPEAHENAVRQLTELIKQNYNHPSICFWGIGNDLTMFGEAPELQANMADLNRVAKSLDPDRITVCAQMMTLDHDSPLNTITDGVGYNVYYGWYVGECEDMDTWLTELKKNGNGKAAAISEYGADGVPRYQNNSPTKGDCSEGYQSYYHEKMLDILSRHDNVWAAYVWNMFDFAAVNRVEGGVKGQNTKGLVTYDRTLKKDAFYLYKAEWSEEPVVHIAGKRYKKRAESRTTLQVYSNAEQVELFVNGIEKGCLCRNGHIFYLSDVALCQGRNEILVKTERGDFDDVILYGECADEPSYYYRHDSGPEYHDGEEEYCVKNGFYSVYDKLNDLLSFDETQKAVEGELGVALINHPMLKLIGDDSLENISRKSGGLLSKEALTRVNRRLLKIRKDS